jgi:ribosomal protein S12 methylthiotransferase
LFEERWRMRNPLRVGLVSLGCPKNTVDSEVMLGHLDRDGVEVTTEMGRADVIVVNTCGFVDAAKEESIATILEAACHKSQGSCRRLVVAGCMVQRYRQELEQEIPEIDAFVDLDGLEEVGTAVGLGDPPERRLSPVRLPLLPPEESAPVVRPSTYLYEAETPRRRSGPPWTAYLKIAEGCDNPCSFCAIPQFRGAFRSRAPADIVREARHLAGEGVRELNLIAQDSTAYGHDLGLTDGPAHLLDRLSRIEGLRWIRLFYVYPNKVEDSLLEVMAARDSIARYIDIPLQHASRPVLARMRRGGSAVSHLQLLERIRRRVPDVAIRSTMIVGFPGETEDDFRQLCDFVSEARFDNLGTFTYSHEDGTGAHALDDDVPPRLKLERRDRLMELQQAIALQRNESKVGRVFTVLSEGSCPETEHLLQGRLEGQAPEVDGRVLINDGEAGPGRFVRVEIAEAHPYDLVGRAIGPA